MAESVISSWVLNTRPWSAAGIRVISRTGKTRGRLTGTRRPCNLAGCTGERLTVRWDNGKVTYPCTKGMTLKKNKRGILTWKIG